MAGQISPASPSTRAQRLIGNWVYGGALAGLMLLGLTPTLTQDWPVSAVLAYLALPAYMIHQYEEHDDDRFRRFMNLTMAGGRDAMTPLAVFVINIFGVWLPLSLCIVLMRGHGEAYGAFAGWLILVNALLHIVTALRSRSYNPGLLTSILLFIPLGTAILVSIWHETSALALATGLVLAVALHAAIMIHMKSRIAALNTPHHEEGGQHGRI